MIEPLSDLDADLRKTEADFANRVSVADDALLLISRANKLRIGVIYNVIILIN